MLALILIFFVGKYFYDLAGRYDRNKWGYAILGVITYYAGTFLIGIIIGVLGEFGVINDVESIPTIVLTIVAIPAGALSSYLLYRYLENRWDKPTYEPPSDVLDSDLINNNSLPSKDETTY
jgi:hypothetical protein